MSSPVTRSKIQDLNNISPASAAAKLGTLLAAIVADIAALASNTRILVSPALAIKAGSSAVAKATAAFSAMVAGVVVTKAANTDMSALVGTLATAKYALWAFYMDSAGSITTSTKTADAGTAAAALALKPAVPTDKVELGYIIVGNATGSNFVGGTTALDAANVTVAYVSSAPLTPASSDATLALT